MKTLDNCHSPVGLRNARLPDHQSQAIKGYLLGGSCKNWSTRYVYQASDMYKTSVKETLALWSMTEVERNRVSMKTAPVF